MGTVGGLGLGGLIVPSATIAMIAAPGKLTILRTMNNL
jgi:hypothetical protein